MKKGPMSFRQQHFQSEEGIEEAAVIELDISADEGTSPCNFAAEKGNSRPGLWLLGKDVLSPPFVRRQGHPVSTNKFC